MKTNQFFLMALMVLGGTVGAMAQSNTVLNTSAASPGSQNVLLGISSGNAMPAPVTPVLINHSNVMVGMSSGLLSDATGGGGENARNVFLGHTSAPNNTTGSDNVFIGFRAGINNSSGNSNIGIGSQRNTPASTNPITGGYNIMIGHANGESISSGARNTFMGIGAGRYNTTGSSNTFLGDGAGTMNVSGNNNISVGAIGPASGSNNIVMGASSAQNCSGNANVLIGNICASNLTTGKENTFIGRVMLPNTAATTLSAGNNTERTIILSNGADWQSQKLYIDATGNTGIGLGDNVIPKNRLDIRGGVAVGAAFTSTLTTAGPIAPTNGMIVEGNVGIGINAPTNRLQITAATGNASGLTFTNLTSASTPLSASNGRVLTVDSNGKVILTTDQGSGGVTAIANGLNTTVSGTGVSPTPYVIDAKNIYTHDDTLNTSVPANTATAGVRTVTMGASNLFFKTSGSGSHFENGTTGSGRIYIGNTLTFPTLTATNQYRLLVEGGILTERIKVALQSTANWADYVFAKEYKLAPLSEVEAFIKENKHLPGIASSESLVKNGIDVAEMQAKQMEKIEELTLYAIEQNKTLEKQNKEIEELKAQVKSLLERK
jgi:hypothetical protein